MKAYSEFKPLFLVIWLVILLTGAFLRFYNLNWDRGHYFHPDERNIVSAVAGLKIPGQLNPHFFAYGSLPLYLYRTSGQIISRLGNEPDWALSAAKINLIGRVWSAFWGTLGILLVFLLADQCLRKKQRFFFGALSAILFSFTPFLIQIAHFSTTESMLVFFIILISLLSRSYFQRPRAKTLFFLILASSAAVATKLSALSFLIIPFSTIFFLFISQKEKVKKLFYRLMVFFLGIVLVFSIFSPYTFFDFPHFQESIRYENGVVLGKLRVPYTLQFQKTLPIVFQFKSLFFSLGPIPTVLGFFGLILFTRQALIKKRIADFPDLVFFFAYLIYVGSWYAKQVRHLVPLYPFFIIFTVYAFAESRNLINRLKNTRLRRKLDASWVILLTVTVFFSLCHGLAFFSIYSRPQTRVAASEWIYTHIPVGAKIFTEHWDDGLPLPLENYPSNSQYDIEPLRIYDEDNQAKLDYYSTKLSRGDYLILSSRRLWGTLINLTKEYPLTSKYYRFLFSGRLGFEKVAEFSTYPCLGYPLRCLVYLNDDAAEETFQVFDHPKIFIFKNSQRLSEAEISRRLKY